MIGRIAIAIAAILIVMWIFGSVLTDNEAARFNALTPEQKAAETRKNCLALSRDWAFKTYSELTVEERKLKFSCEVYLAK